MNEQPIDYSPIDSFHVGRRRKPNFTDHEVLNIVDQYDIHKELLHSREASKSVIAQKQAIWKQITDILNANYPQVARTVEDVRRKWKKLQSEAKREAAAYRAAQASGSTTSISSKQMTLYNRILSICRPSALSTAPHFTHVSVAAATAALQHHQQKHAMMTKNTRDIVFNEQVATSRSRDPFDAPLLRCQSSDQADSPSSDLVIGGDSAQLDSPCDESASLLGHDDNSSSPMTSVQPTLHSPFAVPQANHHQSTMGGMSSNGQISKRTLDKRRKLLKSSANRSDLTSTMKSYGQQQSSLRFEALLKRKRTLELTGQRLIYDKERLLIEQKNISIKLAANECENERVAIEKRRTELALQKLQCDLPTSSNGTTTNNNNSNYHQHASDQDEHDDNNSLDDMSDLNE